MKEHSTSISGTLNSLPESVKKEILELIRTQSPADEVSWFDGKQIDEFLFGEAYLVQHPLIFYNGMFFDRDGRVGNTDTLCREIAEMIRPFRTCNIARTAERLLNAVKLSCMQDEIPVQTDRIHVGNGTLFLNGHFTEEKAICRNRLPVNYLPDAPAPKVLLRFLNDLLEPEDIPTLQEYLGYTLIPTTKAQKLLLVIGDGGEGKSTLGRVLRILIGSNMNTGSIQKLETNKFFLSAQEGQLLLMDDDMELEALRNTATLKTIVTMEDKIDIERKGEQSRQALLYTRLIGFGNGTLKALYDRSGGFFRRYIILVTRPRAADRIDDPFLAEKLAKEKEGILLWCFEGLQRLVANGYRFTISQRAKENLEKAREDGDNIASFMRSDGYIRYQKDASALTRDIYSAYRVWCANNLLTPLGMKSFASHLRAHQTEYDITYNEKLKSRDGKDARGYNGVYVPEHYDGWTDVKDPSMVPFD